jgi:hypothetical protein
LFEYLTRQDLIETLAYERRARLAAEAEVERLRYSIDRLAQGSLDAASNWLEFFLADEGHVK